jgi:hypothetical protein
MRMKIFDRLSVLRTVKPAKQLVATSAAEWSKAREHCPDLVPDLVQMGGVLAMQPATYVDGMAMADPIDPQRLAYEAGRRDLAVQLLTLMGVGAYELMSLMEDKNVG